MQRRASPFSIFICFAVFSSGFVGLGRSDEQPSSEINGPNDAETCRSKVESHLYFKNKLPAKISKPFQSFMAHYERLHQRCTEFSTVAKHLEDTLNPNEENDRCQYVIHKGSGGFGNRMQGLLSSFLFAILTNRTLIVPRDKDADESLLCEPFPKSSWMLQPEHEKQAMAGPKLDIIATIRDDITAGKSRRRAALYTRYDGSEWDAAFFCEQGQKVVQNVSWVILNQARYFGPVFATIPPFRREMDRLFPDRVIFTRIARYLLHPKNNLWEGIVSAYKKKLSGADTLVGLQIRTFTYKNHWAVPRIMQCLANVSAVLPRPLSPAQVSDHAQEGAGSRKLRVLITSMQQHHVSQFRGVYSHGNIKNETVEFHSESSVGFEKWTVEQHATALHDIWLLSFCDILFTSSHSTFGVLAAGLSGTRPWSLNIAVHEYGFANDPDRDWRVNGRPVCALSPSLEPCALPAANRPCAGKDGEELEPAYLRKNCTIDFPYHWQTLTNV